MTPIKRNIKRVAVSAMSFAKNATLVGELKALDLDVVINDTQRVLTKSELIDFYIKAQPDAAIVGTEVIDSSVLDAVPCLRLISKYGVGLDNLDQALLASRGVALAWTAGVNKRSVSELVLAFALGHFHKASSGIEHMRHGRWVKDGGVQLSNLRVGIVGFGHVGSDLASLLRAFGSDIVCHDILDRSEDAARVGARQVTYEELLATADMVSFHVPATDLTANMFSHRELALVKRSALIVNTSRGSVIDFDAATTALLAGNLGGLAIDVYPVEPYQLPPNLASCSQLYCTPHIAGNTREAVLAMGRSAIAGIRTAMG